MQDICRSAGKDILPALLLTYLKITKFLKEDNRTRLLLYVDFLLVMRLTVFLRLCRQAANYFAAWLHIVDKHILRRRDLRVKGQFFA